MQGGASAKAVKRLFDKGARIEGGPINRGELAKWIAVSRRPLLCKWADGGRSGGARIDIGEGVATVAPLQL